MERIEYRRFGYKYMAAMSCFVVPAFLAVVWLVKYGERWEGSSTPFARARAVFLASLGGCVGTDNRLRRSFRCPSCVERLAWPAPGKPGAPIDFRCQRCQRVYVTGLQEPSDD